jgi:hypothetical protein
MEMLFREGVDFPMKSLSGGTHFPRSVSDLSPPVPRLKTSYLPQES